MTRSIGWELFEDEIVWAVNPKYDSVASLASYYSLFAQRFLNLAGVACRLQVADSFPDAPMDSRMRHGLFLAFKEALNNAVRHSRATEVLFEIAVQTPELRVRITDNGCGFAADQTKDGNGLANYNGRLAGLGGHCQICSRPGGGTAITFVIPLPAN